MESLVNLLITVVFLFLVLWGLVVLFRRYYTPLGRQKIEWAKLEELRRIARALERLADQGGAHGHTTVSSDEKQSRGT